MNTLSKRRKWGSMLTLYERHKIEILHSKGCSLREIASCIGCHYSTVSKELKFGSREIIQNGVIRTVYDCLYAQQKTEINVKKRGAPYKLLQDKQTLHVLEECIINHNYSPYAAITKLTREDRLYTHVCVNTIYNYIKAGLTRITENHLPYGFSRKNATLAFSERKDTVLRQGGKSIEKRPLSILSREEFGHWEGDLIIGRQGHSGAILTLIERKTRFLITEYLPDKKQASIQQAFNKIEQIIGTNAINLFKSITFDNGIEFRNTDAIQTSLYAGKRIGDIYYTHPYRSTERASNENVNRMLRRAFPKGTNFELINNEQVQKQTNWINQYPRKILGGRSAREMFEHELYRLCKDDYF